MLIPECYLARLRAAGLLVSEPFPPTHVGFPDGVIVGKPASVRGNSLSRYEATWDEGPLVDAPSVLLHFSDSHWFVTMQEYFPRPGPGDFVNEWPTADEAIDDILELYFGSPARMLLKQHARDKPGLSGE